MLENKFKPNYNNFKIIKIVILVFKKFYKQVKSLFIKQYNLIK